MNVVHQIATTHSSVCSIETDCPVSAAARRECWVAAEHDRRWVKFPIVAMTRRTPTEVPVAVLPGPNLIAKTPFSEHAKTDK